ncbi:hypothetical protein KXS07_12850 [Inquilinus limosus]|uniref:hypothetical protein n=1 Tax=Inquilinus limosus TaxID=171674 RepID=UPI003F13D620
MPRREPITADELMRRLEADPEWIARRAERDRLHEERTTALRENEAPLIAALRNVGVDVRSAWLLNDKHPNYHSAIPVLLDHLDREYLDRIREGIARSLGSPEARQLAWDKVLSVLQQLRSTPQSDFRDGLVAAVSGMARSADLPKLIELVADPALGQSRLLLISKLSRSKQPEALAILEKLKDDPDLYKEISYRLKRKTLHEQSAARRS